MAVEENIELIRRWFKEVWNEGRVQTIYDLMDDNVIAVGQDRPGVVLHGPAEFAQLHKRLHGAFPDIKITLEDAFGDGDKVVARWSGQMTHTGDQLGMPLEYKSARYRHNHRRNQEWQNHPWLGQLGPTGNDATVGRRG